MEKEAPAYQGHQAGGGKYCMFPPTGARGRWELGARSGAGYPMIGTTPLDDHFTTSQVGFVNRLFQYSSDSFIVFLLASEKSLLPAKKPSATVAGIAHPALAAGFSMK